MPDGRECDDGAPDEAKEADRTKYDMPEPTDTLIGVVKWRDLLLELFQYLEHFFAASLALDEFFSGPNLERFIGRGVIFKIHLEFLYQSVVFTWDWLCCNRH